MTILDYRVNTITAPNAMIASYLPVSAISFAIKGNSHAPGTQYISIELPDTS